MTGKAAGGAGAEREGDKEERRGGEGEGKRSTCSGTGGLEGRTEQT